MFFVLNRQKILHLKLFNMAYRTTKSLQLLFVLTFKEKGYRQSLFCFGLSKHDKKIYLSQNFDFTL
jgi:hypothetical protein